jgi:hypothetical protein
MWFHFVAIALLVWIGTSVRRSAEILREINDHLADWPGGPVEMDRLFRSMPLSGLRLTGGSGGLISTLWPSLTSSQRQTRV